MHTAEGERVFILNAEGQHYKKLNLVLLILKLGIMNGFSFPPVVS